MENITPTKTGGATNISPPPTPSKGEKPYYDEDDKQFESGFFDEEDEIMEIDF